MWWSAHVTTGNPKANMLHLWRTRDSRITGCMGTWKSDVRLLPQTRHPVGRPNDLFLCLAELNHELITLLNHFLVLHRQEGAFVHGAGRHDRFHAQLREG